MTQTVSTINSLNPLSLSIILGTLVFLIILLLFFIPRIIKKLGVTAITKDGITLSTDQIKAIQNSTSEEIHERQRKQLDYIDIYCKSVRNIINQYIEDQGYRYSDFNVPFTISMIKEEVISWILFDDLHDDDESLKLYEKKIWLIYRNAVWSSERGRDYIKIKFKGKELERKDCSIDWKGEFFQNGVSTWLRELLIVLCKM